MKYVWSIESNIMINDPRIIDLAPMLSSMVYTCPIFDISLYKWPQGAN